MLIVNSNKDLNVYKDHAVLAKGETGAPGCCGRSGGAPLSHQEKDDLEANVGLSLDFNAFAGSFAVYAVKSEPGRGQVVA